MTFRAQNVQPAYIGDALAEIDIRSPASHIRRNRNIAVHFPVTALMLLARLCDDLRLALVVLGIENLVLKSESPVKRLR